MIDRDHDENNGDIMSVDKRMALMKEISIRYKNGHRAPSDTHTLLLLLDEEVQSRKKVMEWLQLYDYDQTDLDHHLDTVRDCSMVIRMLKRAYYEYKNGHPFDAAWYLDAAVSYRADRQKDIVHFQTADTYLEYLMEKDIEFQEYLELKGNL